jgi:uncharacterized Zn-binding protein involved in type VI secretion
MSQAARVGDLQECPKGNPGGAILAGEATVNIEGRPAARVGDAASCTDGPTKIGSGSPTVYIGGRKAARVGDATCHLGKITTGAGTVYVGDAGSGGSSAMNTARQNAAPFVKP